MGRKTSLKSYEASKWDENGRNTEYRHRVTKETISSKEMIKKVKNNEIVDGHTRTRNGKEFVATNPDKKENNNLDKK